MRRRNRVDSTAMPGMPRPAGAGETRPVGPHGPGRRRCLMIVAPFPAWIAMTRSTLAEPVVIRSRKPTPEPLQCR